MKKNEWYVISILLIFQVILVSGIVVYRQVVTPTMPNSKQGNIEVENSLDNKEVDNTSMVTFIDDDGRKELITKMVPIFESKNVPLTCAIVKKFAENPGSDFVGLDNLKKLHASGKFELVPHTVTHPHLTELTDNEILKELTISKAFMRDNGFEDEFIVYPYGDVNEKVEKVSERYFELGIGTKWGLNRKPFNTYNLVRINIHDRNLEEYKAIVDEGIAKKSWIIFMMHSFQPEWTPEYLDMLSTLIDYIKSQNIPIMKVSDAYIKLQNK